MGSIVCELLNVAMSFAFTFKVWSIHTTHRSFEDFKPINIEPGNISLHFCDMAG